MGEAGRERRARRKRDRARREEGLKAERRDYDAAITAISEPHAAPPRWQEFRDYAGAAGEWVRTGNVALVPGLIERIGGGFSMYVHTRDASTFAIAAKMLDCDPRSVPAGRKGANLNGEFLLRAIVLCRRDRLGHAPTAEATRLAIPIPDPWTSRCPECSAPFDHVATHSFTGLVEWTAASCARGHRWLV